MVKKTINTLFALLTFSVMAYAQNPTSLTAERTDNTGAVLNLKNVNGFWHFSGPRSYEANNKLSIFWNDGTYHRLLSINDNGNVGIGISNPLPRLHVFNGASGENPHSYSDFSVEDDDHVMMTLMTANTKYAYYGFADAEDDFVGGIQYSHPSDMMYFRVNDRSADMVIDKNGLVGIGNTAPQHSLDVRGVLASTHNNGHKVTLHASGDGNSYLNFSDGTTTSRIGFQINGGSKMSIMNNGNVGIGTTSPDSELAVNGNIHAKEVKVDLIGWPDYVFKEGYDLPTLEEVEQHIQEKGHLINIPSAKEVEENGIQLGEMNKLLLEKIEELTLYVIELKKENEQIKELVKIKK